MIRVGRRETPIHTNSQARHWDSEPPAREDTRTAIQRLHSRGHTACTWLGQALAFGRGQSLGYRQDLHAFGFIDRSRWLCNGIIIIIVIIVILVSIGGGVTVFKGFAGLARLWLF